MRLVEVACRKIAGETWAQIAAAMGWRSKQAVQQWAVDQLRRLGFVDDD